MSEKVDIKFETFSDFYKQVCNVGVTTKYFSVLDQIDAQLFAYQGFNPETVAAAFFSHAEVAHKDDHKAIMQDVANVVAIGLMRNNIREDQLNRTQDAGAKLIRELAARYKIKIKKDKSEKIILGPRTITFIRCLSVFPIPASIMAHEGVFANTNIENAFDSKDLPAELKHPGAAALIPKTNTGNVYFIAHVAFMIELSKVIDQESKKIPLKDLYTRQAHYGELARDSNVVNAEERVKFYRAYNLDTPEVFKRVWTTYSKIMIKLGSVPTELDKFKTSEDRIIVNKEFSAVLKDYKLEEYKMKVKKPDNISTVTKPSTNPEEETEVDVILPK